MKAALPANHLHISAGQVDLTFQKTGRKKWYTRGSLNMIVSIVITDGFRT